MTSGMPLAGSTPRARALLLAGLCVLPLVQCGRRAAPSRVPTGAALTVMTFNVNYGVDAHPDNLAAITDGDADLVLLQETTERAEAAIRAQLSETYPYMVFSHCCGAGGLAVLSKYPIVQRQQLPPTVGWFPAERVVLATPMGQAQVLNVHLRPPVSDSGSWVSGYFSTRSLRGEEMEAFWREVDPDLPTIVAGDFNESRNGRAIGFLQSKGLRTVLPEVKPHATTWRWPTPLGTMRAQLDHIVVDERWRATATDVVDTGRSDHLPVVATLTMRARPTVDDGAHGSLR